MRSGVVRDMSEIFQHASSQNVCANEMCSTVARPAPIAAADIVVVASLVCMIPLHIQDAATVCAVEQSGKQSNFIKPRRASALLPELLHTFPCLRIYNGFVMVFKNDLLFDWILQSTFAFIGLLFGLEIHQMAKIFSALEDVRDGIICPAALMPGMITPCAAGSAKFQRSGRWDFLLGQHPGNFAWPISSKAQAVNLLDNRGGFLIYNKIAVLVHEIAVSRLTGGGLSTHPLGPFGRSDFLTGIAYIPFVEQVPQ